MAFIRVFTKVSFARNVLSLAFSSAVRFATLLFNVRFQAKSINTSRQSPPMPEITGVSGKLSPRAVPYHLFSIILLSITTLMAAGAAACAGLKAKIAIARKRSRVIKE